MIVRIVRLTLLRHQVAEFDALFAKHREQILAQQGCLGVELLTDSTRPFVRATLSRWDSEADLNAYRSSALFGVIWPATKVLFSAPPQVWSYEVVEAG